METLIWRGYVGVCRWWAVEVACIALFLDFSAVSFPGCAAMMTGGTSRIVAFTELVIAVLGTLKRIVSGYDSTCISCA